MLKKNNVLLPKNLINKKLSFIYWTNFYKVLAIAAIVIGFFGAVPLLYKSGNKINIENLELDHIHSIEFINSLCFIKKKPSKDNKLGKRVVSGESAIVVPDRKKLNNQIFK